jgi:thiamine pyrophosphate-dependent acetolactate synthase large subunit-like protein
MVTQEFKKNFEIVAEAYGLKGFDDTEYKEFKAIVKKMLAENPDFTVQWISDMAFWREKHDYNEGVVPYTYEENK